MRCNRTVYMSDIELSLGLIYPRGVEQKVSDYVWRGMRWMVLSTVAHSRRLKEVTDEM